MPSAIFDFVRNAKAKGVEDDAVVMVLRQRGWSDGKIYDALTAYYEDSLGFAAPARGGRAESAREAFFYLLSFAMLGVWVVALVWLGDMLIDRAFPSALDYDNLYQRSSIAWQMASIIIAFPIYLWIGYLLSREVAKRPETLDSGVRKWLTYIALVITAGTLVGDGVWFLTTFLTGEISQRFIFKALMLFVIVGCVYWYYLATIRVDRPTGSYNRTFGSLAVVGVLLAVILGFVGIGSPSYGLGLNYDNQRTRDLYWLEDSVHDVYSPKKGLPRGLAQVDPAGSHSIDPSGRPYTYLPGTGANYRLCANFDTDTRANTRDSWRHGKGLWCYRLDATRVGDRPQSS